MWFPLYLWNVAKVGEAFWQLSPPPGAPAEAINPINCCRLQYLDSCLPPPMSCLCSGDVSGYQEEAKLIWLDLSATWNKLLFRTLCLSRRPSLLSHAPGSISQKKRAGRRLLWNPSTLVFCSATTCYQCRARARSDLDWNRGGWLSEKIKNNPFTFFLKRSKHWNPLKKNTGNIWYKNESPHHIARISNTTAAKYHHLLTWWHRSTAAVYVPPGQIFHRITE